MERLDKVLSGTGRWSRREVKELVRRGRVLLDGVPAASPEQKIDPETADIRVDGETVSCRRFTYVLLHKPAGVLSAVEDSRQRTVLDLLPQELKRQGLSPVGRLDKDTEGLLLITDDGALNHSLLAPGRHVPKTYYARIHGIVTESDITAFKNGLDIGEKKMTAPAALKILHIAENEQTSEILVTITEGKFHQIKRMFQSVGKKVSYLKRLSMGSLHLDEKLAPGAWRELTLEEITKLKEETI